MIQSIRLASVVLSAIVVLPATAQSINEDIKVVASDAAAGDIFGGSIAISGTTGIVGAWADDDAGSFSGSAYLFDSETGQELFKLTASDAAAGDEFGLSVAISRTTAIVGAQAHDDTNSNSNSGSAYLFDTETGRQLFKLTASDAAENDFFGHSVAISGTTAIVGAFFNDDAGDLSGSAYLFDTETGQELFKLTASDAVAGGFFGDSVAISGSTAIVGSPNTNDAGPFSGSAYIFDTETGQELFKLTASDAAAGDNFGSSVAISGTTAIIGLFVVDDNGGSNSGSAYLFDTTTGLQIAKLTASDTDSEDIFGYPVSISHTMAIVGAFKDDDAGSSSGSAYIFDTQYGTQIAKLTASDAAPDDHFGNSVAISGTNAIVGAPNDDDAGSLSGSAYLFDLPPCLVNPADLTEDGILDFFDISAFLSEFAAQSPLGDINNDGVWDFFDISSFLTAFGEGCP